MTHPNGDPGIYGVVRFQNRAVGVLPVDGDTIWMVGQYRYCLQSYEWEIPEGGCPAGESLEEAARRELLEETGIMATHLELLQGGIQLSNSVTDEVGWLFLARGLSQVAGLNLDPSERIEVGQFRAAEVFQWLEEGRIHDAMTVIALLRWRLMLSETGAVTGLKSALR